MAFVAIHPRYRSFLERHGLVRPDQFLSLPAEIVSGHPDRRVTRVLVGTGPDAIPAFLKREHRVSWQERLRNTWAGFGFVSKSVREARFLHALEQAGLGAPEAMAAGEDEHGQSFLLVRELTGMVDLRVFLRDLADLRRRRAFFRRLGQTLADVHQAHFDHPDLYCKHVLVHPADGTIRLLDWQRSCQRWRGRRRLRDLAALHATLADDLANGRERLTCLRAYLEHTRPCTGRFSTKPKRRWLGRDLRKAMRIICRKAARLLRRRRIRELRKTPLPVGAQNLIALDGEALCVTPAFRTIFGDCYPQWLTDAAPTFGVHRTTCGLGDGVEGTVIRRRGIYALARLWARLRQHPFRAPEWQLAALLFRLERFGIETPTLLACGQRHGGTWAIESVLFTSTPSNGTTLAEWLSQLSPEAVGPRRRVLRQLGALLQSMHAAGCYGGVPNFRVRVRATAGAKVVLGSVDGIRVRRRAAFALVRRDLAALGRLLPASHFSCTDRLRLFLAYIGPQQPKAKAKHSVRRLLRGFAP
jgi:tRNA A-37 threonylcarbamoyl transferase component Bud32